MWLMWSNSFYDYRIECLVDEDRDDQTTITVRKQIGNAAPQELHRETLNRLPNEDGLLF